ALVVDFKDDYGILTYNTKLELPRSIGVVHERFNAEELIDLAHRSGIHLIARILVFKDRALYRYKNYAYATWDKKTNWAWAHLFRIREENQESQDGNQTAEYSDTNGEEPKEGIQENGQPEGPVETAQKPVRYYQKEHWVDPFAPFIWEYNIAVAKELQDLGVDEIQFDYIRFPTDGDLKSITYRHKRDGMTPMDALESFLAMAREVITIPISTDLYGFNSWHRMGNWNGQSIEMVCDYVDVIAPMFYPSHFPRAFIGGLEYTERAKQIYREGTSRAASIAAGRSIIRPYIQAFLIGGEVNFSEQLYANYLKRQIEGTLEAPSSGYTLWNAGNNYYMLTFPLQGLLPE
ncbi:MAG TPA: putative glycoside hydrolase, partial [Spirochaetia bacterium]|nr:putative glycoside hydrolase [Spirochaetia bacterium]